MLGPLYSGYCFHSSQQACGVGSTGIPPLQMKKLRNWVPEAHAGRWWLTLGPCDPKAHALSPEPCSLAGQPFLPALLLKAMVSFPLMSTCSGSSEGCGCPGSQSWSQQGAASIIFPAKGNYPRLWASPVTAGSAGIFSLGGLST